MDDKEKRKVLKLDTLKGGVGIEMVNNELERVCNDIVDLSKTPDSKRKIVLEIELKPTKDGRFGTAKLNCKSTLGTQREQNTSLFFGVDTDGQGIASERMLNERPFPELDTDETN